MINKTVISTVSYSSEFPLQFLVSEDDMLVDVPKEVVRLPPTSGLDAGGSVEVGNLASDKSQRTPTKAINVTPIKSPADTKLAPKKLSVGPPRDAGRWRRKPRQAGGQAAAAAGGGGGGGGGAGGAGEGRREG